MPVYNQVSELPSLLDKCKETMPADHFFIVDNGSNDGSAELIKDSGFDCVHLDRNYGIGYALRLGVMRAKERNHEIVVNLAGNGKMLPNEMDRFITPIVNNHADYVSGSRFLKGGQSPNLPLFRRISIPLIVNTLVCILFRKRLTDATCGYRAYRTSIVDQEGVDWQAKWLDKYQFEYYLYAKAIKLKLRCIEVPCSMIYPNKSKNYSKIRPFIGWWHMLQPWLLVGLRIR